MRNNQTLFSRDLSKLFMVVLLILSSSPGYSNDRCPSSSDHSLSAVRYQLYTAFHMGFDGYEAPCEIMCMGNADCQKNCQSKKGLELLSQKMTKMFHAGEIENSCLSFSTVCLEQCRSLGEGCKSACHPNRNI